jgi:putative ABC transport system permease protein
VRPGAPVGWGPRADPSTDAGAREVIYLEFLNAVCAAWATVLDSRRAAALSRALGASPQQVTAGVTWAQMLSAVPGALLGIPLGLGLFLAAGGGGALVIPSAWSLAAAVLVILAAVALMASIPALIGARIPASQVLQAESGVVIALPGHCWSASR